MPRKIQREKKTAYFPQHCLYFFLLPQGQGSLRPTFGPVRLGFGFSLERWSAASLTTSLGFALSVLDGSSKALVEVCDVCCGILRTKSSHALTLEPPPKMFS